MTKLNPAIYGKERAKILAIENPDKCPIVLSDCIYCKARLVPKEGSYHFHGYVEDVPKKKVKKIVAKQVVAKQVVKKIAKKVVKKVVKKKGRPKKR